MCVLVLPPYAAAAGGGLSWPHLYPSHGPFGIEAFGIHNPLICFLKFCVTLKTEDKKDKIWSFLCIANYETKSTRVPKLFKHFKKSPELLYRPAYLM